MKLFLCALPFLLFSSHEIFASENGYRYELVDPSIQKLCNNLMKKREQKIYIKHKIQDMIQKNYQLSAKAQPKQKKVTEKFHRIDQSLNFNLTVVNENILDLNETIIRSGCPPLDLNEEETTVQKNFLEKVTKDFELETLNLEDIESSTNNLLP